MKVFPSIHFASGQRLSPTYLDLSEHRKAAQTRLRVIDIL
jgi:hypothetical protein